MEIFEVLFFGLEPLTALAVGVGALVLAPVIGVVGTVAGKDTAVGESLSESSKNLTKAGLIWGMDVLDKTQTFVAEAGESFQDLVAEASAERAAAASKAPDRTPHQVPIN